MVRLLFGAAKGAIVGGGIGYGAYVLGMTGGWGYLVYGVIGAAVGFLVGRPVWSHLLDAKSTVWTSIMKAIFGFGIGCGLFALARHAVSLPEVALLDRESRSLADWPFVFGGVVGLLYGAWVEVDDPPAKKAKKLSDATAGK